ncbi:GGDEF domain-containing protein [Chitinimonas lacunae]|uniref:diguanylate cyclase n=1 Tax=Chitinimonas lacunae TaxID=1963018 RepID=A0ABV8MJ72_9NEIS
MTGEDTDLSGNDEEFDQRVDDLLSNPANADNSLLEDVRWLASAYCKLRRRVRKISLISDRQQTELMELNRYLQVVSRTDPLTGLLNRRGLIERFETELSRLSRSSTTLGVLMLDIDHFKRINDHYGHQLGDEVLVALAKLLQQRLRTYDHAARWGGEELLLLLPDTPRDGTEAVAQQILDEVRALRWNARDLTVTVSIGVTVAYGADSLDSCLKRADEALYHAKRQGRDRYALA